MRLDLLSVTLRQRSPWEAMDLGIALVRRHALAIWQPWFALTLPFFLLANAIGWLTGKVWLAALIMWWLKPLFDRVPLYVLSRAVFGTVPSVRQTLRAPELRSGWPLFAWLSWRRLHPSRSLLLPVDMLEGLRGSSRGARVQVLQRAISSQALGLIFACANFEAIIAASVWVLALMFVPVEFLSESARAVWQTFFQDPPAWAQLTANLVSWLSMSLVEPFYVGAGFGLYLNRRTQLEAWDVELIFRRLAERAAQAVPSAASLLLALLLLGASLAPTPSLAAAAKADEKLAPQTPREFVGTAWQDHDRRFADAVGRAFKDPLLAPKQTVTRWELRNPQAEKKNESQPAWLRALATLFGFLAEYGLWLAAGALLGFVLWRLPKWLPWVRRQMGATTEVSEILEQDVESKEALPDDIARVVFELWQTEHRREALALLYRASVERVAERLGTPFPPGATEAECLRRARKLGGNELQAEFALVVRTWQRAAYAWQFPEPAEFEALMRGWSPLFEARP